MYVAYICEGCQGVNKRHKDIFLCVGCQKEVCENCFDSYASCKDCAKNKTEKERKKLAKEFGYDFE